MTVVEALAHTKKLVEEVERQHALHVLCPVSILQLRAIEVLREAAAQTLEKRRKP